MTKLSAEAYAIVEGRHSDPFHYLGLHTEGDKTVVRAFLPEASKVDAIDEHGEAAALARRWSKLADREMLRPLTTISPTSI
jgi:1,4-alpha-glucan branching enzyme